MRSLLKTVVQDYSWIHSAISAFSNLTFFVGVIFVLPSGKSMLTVGVWLFIFGSLWMMVAALGDFFVKYYEMEERRAARQAQT